MNRRGGGPRLDLGDDLEPVDPDTGVSLGGPAHDAESDSESELDDTSAVRRRARRLRRTAALLLGAAFAAGLLAGWFTLSIRSLRTAERTWRQAMAIDEARAHADSQVRNVFAAATRDEDGTERDD